MTTSPRPPHGRDDDGVRIVTRERGRRFLWVLLGLLALPVIATVVTVMVVRSAPHAASARAPVPAAPSEALAEVESAPVASPATAATPERHVLPRRIVRAPVADEPAGLGASPVPVPQKPRREIDAADVIVALREEGIHDGIAAFGLPGSHPPKPGILVPEEFELPEGYVRHYQSTDEGQQLPAILMFHPDYEFVNEQGEVVKLPNDLVVPPEMAPPGLDTKQVLEVPERPRGEPIR